MRYKVTHSEKYVLADSINFFEYGDQITEKYNVYSDLIDYEMRKLLAFGDRIYFQYDDYIKLCIELVK